MINIRLSNSLNQSCKKVEIIFIDLEDGWDKL